MLGQQQSVLGNGLKLVGEVFVPGASELLEGKLGSGLAHALVAGAAGLVLAGISPLLAGMSVLAVQADSFSRSVNGRSLFSALSGAAMENGGGAASASEGTTTRSRPSSTTST